MFTFAVNTLKQMWTGFSFLNFEFRRIYFEVGFVTPYYIPIMFDFIETIAFLAFGII